MFLPQEKEGALVDSTRHASLQRTSLKTSVFALLIQFRADGKNREKEKRRALGTGDGGEAKAGGHAEKVAAAPVLSCASPKWVVRVTEHKAVVFSSVLASGIIGL